MPKTSTPSQKFVGLTDIKEGVVILPGGQMVAILLASSINFALKSTTEQQAILQQFQTFLNTLDFSFQVYVQSRRLNIEPYLEILQERDKLQDNDLMKIQLREYIDFIRSFNSEIDIMSKNFYVVIPYSPTPINISRGLLSIFKTKKANTAEQNFEENRSQLEQRIAVVVSGLSSLGVRTIALKDDALVELFYHIYNPVDAAGKAPSRS